MPTFHGLVGHQNWLDLESLTPNIVPIMNRNSSFFFSIPPPKGNSINQQHFSEKWVPASSFFFSVRVRLYSSSPSALSSKIHIFLTSHNYLHNDAFFSHPSNSYGPFHLLQSFKKNDRSSCEGMGGFPLSITEKSSSSFGPSESAQGPALYCVFLSFYSASVVKTGRQQSKNKGRQWKGGRWGRGCMEKV